MGKPSEEIREIFIRKVNALKVNPLDTIDISREVQIIFFNEAILEYLDREWEKKNAKN